MNHMKLKWWERIIVLVAQNDPEMIGSLERILNALRGKYNG